jgi:hypothetical protein
VRDSGSGTDTSGTATRGAAAYSERLYVTWYWWPLPLLAAMIIAAEVDGALRGLLPWLPYALLIPLTAALIFRAGRARVAVRDDELLVGDARLPLRFVTEVETFGPREKRRVLGPHLNPAAFVQHRGWVGPVLRIRHTDPADKTPYWLFSSRHPEQLAEILRAATRSSRS